MVLLSEPAAVARRAWRIDRVFLACVAILAALAALAPGQAVESLRFTADALVYIAPFIAVSVLVAAYAKASGLDGRIAVAFAAGPWRAVVLAAAFGAVSPFCSCGVVPLIAGLLAAGVPLAPVMAFWLASPLMDPEIFILMLPVFGLEFTVAKLLAAFGIGLAAGAATQLMAGRLLFADPLRPGVGGGGCGAGSALAAAPAVPAFWREPERRAAFARESRATGLFLLKWLTLAFLLESLMLAWIPAESVGSLLGGAAWWAVPASVLLGVPAYLNGYAAIPTVDALIGMGMAPGAGLGFMLGGGVTCIPAAVAVYALVKRPVFLWYIAWGLAGALAAAYAYQGWTSLPA